MIMHKCAICHKNFTLLKNLKRHTKNIHGSVFEIESHTSCTKISKYKCVICSRVFLRNSTLKRHEKQKHKKPTTPKISSLKFTNSKCVTFEQTNLSDYPLLEKLIPEDYVYKVNHLKSLENGKFKAKFEIADCTKDIFLVWLSELSPKSLVTYRVKSFTKSPNTKIVFNKVFRCIHNTFPRKTCNPHPMHTGCPATLTVRIRKCCESLSVRSTISDNNVIMTFSFKAIITLYHDHNHSFIHPLNLKQNDQKKKKKNNVEHKNKTCVNQFQIKNSFNQVSSPKLNNPSSAFLNSLVPIKTVINTSLTSTYENIENVVLLNEFQNNSYAINNNIENMLVENDNLELLEECHDNISVDSENSEDIERSLYNDDTLKELNHILDDYNTNNEKMLQHFKSNPKYFLTAIKAYTLTMKNNLTYNESLLNALYSFGRH